MTDGLDPLIVMQEVTKVLNQRIDRTDDKANLALAEIALIKDKISKDDPQAAIDVLSDALQSIAAMLGVEMKKRAALSEAFHNMIGDLAILSTNNDETYRSAFLAVYKANNSLLEDIVTATTEDEVERLRIRQSNEEDEFDRAIGHPPKEPD